MGKVGRAGLEPATKCLKGACSTIELTTRLGEPQTIAQVKLRIKSFGIPGRRSLRKSSFTNSVILSEGEREMSLAEGFRRAGVEGP